MSTTVAAAEAGVAPESVAESEEDCEESAGESWVTTAHSADRCESTSPRDGWLGVHGLAQLADTRDDCRRVYQSAMLSHVSSIKPQRIDLASADGV